MSWKCSECGTGDPELYYESGKMSKCKDCQRFYNLSENASKPRKRGRTPNLAISKSEFLAWSRAGKRKCVYCGVTEPELAKVGIKTQIGLELAALGVDRVNNDGDYTKDNIELCCFPCNKAKGNVFSRDEMAIIGAAIRQVWDIRLRTKPTR